VAKVVGEVQKDVSEILRLLRHDIETNGNRCSMPAEAELRVLSYKEHHHSIVSHAEAAGRSSEIPLIEIRPEEGCKVVKNFSFDTRRGSEASAQGIAAENSLQPEHKSRSQHQLTSLPYSWPRGLKMREGLEQNFDLQEKSTNTIDTGGSVMVTPPPGWQNLAASRFTSVLDDAQRAEHAGLLRRCMIDPCSRTRIVFDGLSYLVLLFNLLFIPIVLAFQCVPQGPTIAAFYFASSWWTTALVLNFLTGYYKNGELVMVPCTVMRHYLRHWFVPEVVLVIIDWVNVSRLERELIMSGGKARIFWLLSALRAWKMLRAARDLLMEANFRDQIRSALRIMLFISVGLCVNHWVACVWIWIGSTAKFESKRAWTVAATHSLNDFSWFAQEELGQDCYIDRRVMYMYMTALHWSVAQFTLSGMDIICVNGTERLFVVICQVFGLLAGSTLVSVIAAKMVEWQMMRNDQTRRIRQLQLFLEQQNVQHQLWVRVRRQVRDRQRQAERLTEHDVPALKLLSSSLLQDLRCEIFRPYVSTHPLFRLWASLDGLVVTRLCSDSIDLTVQRENDHLFQAGFHAQHMFFLVCGQLSYIQAPGFFEGEARPVVVDQDTWLCEAALWSNWIHVGKAEAMMGSQTLRVSAEGVVRALDTHRLVQKVSREYCNQFHKRLTSAVPPVASFPNDLHVPFTDYTDIILSMKQKMQVTVGLHALNVASAQVDRFWRAARGRASVQSQSFRLKHEIINGESAVMLNNQGALERVVSVVALRIEREDGCILCQLWKSLKLNTFPEPCCQLPGGKQKAGETHGDAVMRILSTKLAPLHLCTEVGKSVCEPEWKDSKEYGVRTKYMRTETVCIMRTLSTDDIQNQRPEVTEKNIPETHSDEEEPDQALPDKEGSLHAVESIDLLGRPIGLMRDMAARVIYAWLTPSEFEYFRTSNGETELNECIPELKRRSGFLSV